MSLRQSGTVACKFNDGNLHAETDSKVRHTVLPCVTGRGDHSFNSALTETSRNKNTVGASEHLGRLLRLKQLRLHPLEIHPHTVFITAVAQCLRNRKIGVMKLGVLADNSNRHALFRIGNPPAQRPPVRESGLRSIESKTFADNRVETGLMKHQRHVIKTSERLVLHHAIRFDVAEQSDLLPDAVLERLIAPGDNHIRHDAHALQLAHRMLCGFCFVLAGAF